MSDPFRGNVPALLERETALVVENRALELEVERLRYLLRPKDAPKGGSWQLPVVFIAVCIGLQLYFGARILARQRAGPSVGHAVDTAPKPAEPRL